MTPSTSALCTLFVLFLRAQSRKTIMGDDLTLQGRRDTRHKNKKKSVHIEIWGAPTIMEKKTIEFSQPTILRFFKGVLPMFPIKGIKNSLWTGHWWGRYSLKYTIILVKRQNECTLESVIIASYKIELYILLWKAKWVKIPLEDSMALWRTLNNMLQVAQEFHFWT